MRALPLLLSLSLGCVYREQLGDTPPTGCTPECVPPATCGGGGRPGVCGVDACGGCFSPFFSPQCWLSSSGSGFQAERYRTPGTCDPLFRRCDYSKEVEECPEDCSAGLCVGGGFCTLSSLCSAPLGCKWIAAAELRCVQVDHRREGELCDEATSGLRCGSRLVCVKPSYVPQPVCGRLCETTPDCFGLGLRREGVCIKNGSLGSFGFCQ